MPLVQSGHGLQQIITGVKLTLLTVVQSDKEILILEETQQLTENHLILQIKPSTILRDSFMRNQIALKTWIGGMMMINHLKDQKVGEITNQL